MPSRYAIRSVVTTGKIRRLLTSAGTGWKCWQSCRTFGTSISITTTRRWASHGSSRKAPWKRTCPSSNPLPLNPWSPSDALPHLTRWPRRSNAGLWILSEPHALLLQIPFCRKKSKKDDSKKFANALAAISVTQAMAWAYRSAVLRTQPWARNGVAAGIRNLLRRRALNRVCW